ncbi:hypothetical protein IPG41_07225 [Candidatus Peregrinibacteria bacterium]|nr:MAG: hypothetical protein IPG41_07225 [Candidatus Peregrinibacteria bacterium]
MLLPMLENLTQLGFTKKEATVYVTLLRNGPTLASTLALRTGLKRVTVYGVLDSLTLRGLVSFEGTEEGRRYLPHHPECLLYSLEQEKAALQMKWNQTRDCIQNLSQPLFSQTLDSRQVLFFRGTLEVHAALEEFFDPLQDLHGLLPQTLTSNEKDFFRKLFSNTQKHYRKAKMLAHAPLLKWMKNHFKIQTLEHVYNSKKGTLFVQSEKVFFLCERQELELMLIRNSDYSKRVFEVLMEPYL